MEEALLKLFESFPSLNKEEIQAIASNITTREASKGTILLRAGNISRECFSVLKGCVRQYHIKDGEEITTAFFTEGEPVASFTSYIEQTPADHFLVCSEDCLLTVGTKEKEDAMIAQFPKLEGIIRSEMEKNSGKAQKEFATFISSSPEERYTNLLNNRPDLLNRVPQHQIASYLGIKPESLSRLRKRLSSKK